MIGGRERRDQARFVQWFASSLGRHDGLGGSAWRLKGLGGSGIRAVGRSGCRPGSGPGGGGANRNLEAALPFLVFEFEKGFAVLVHPQPDPGVARVVAQEQVGGTIWISAYFASILARSIPEQDLFHLDDPVLGLTLAGEEIGQLLPLLP